MENLVAILLNLLKGLTISLYTDLLKRILQDKTITMDFNFSYKKFKIRANQIGKQLLSNLVEPYRISSKIDYESKSVFEKRVDFISFITFLFIIAAFLFMFVSLFTNLNSYKGLIVIVLVYFSFIPTFYIFKTDLASFINYQLKSIKL